MNISEIEKMAGVSKAAVSRYLNNGYLSQEKRAAIRAVIEKTGYRPSVQAQMLRTGQTRTVGVILPRIDSFSVSGVMTGIDAVLEENGFQILLADTHNDPRKELAYLETFDERVDGVILIATVLTPAHTACLKSRKVPVVVVGQRLNGIPCVYHDDYHAFYDMTSLVLGKGCRRAGYIGALAQDKAVGQERWKAFCDAARDAGLPGQDVHAAIADFSIQSGRETARELLESCGPLDALICATDAMAVGALQYLKERNIRVPEQMLLTGHGNSELGGVTTPAITTIRYFYEESGSDAASLLLERIKHPDTPAKGVKLGYKLIERASTQINMA